MPKRKKEISQEKLAEYARAVIEKPFFIPEISADNFFERVQDDHDGTFEGVLQVFFSRDGDAFVTTDKHQGRLCVFGIILEAG